MLLGKLRTAKLLNIIRIILLFSANKRKEELEWYVGVNVAKLLLHIYANNNTSANTPFYTMSTSFLYDSLESWSPLCHMLENFSRLWLSFCWHRFAVQHSFNASDDEIRTPLPLTVRNSSVLVSSCFLLSQSSFSSDENFDLLISLLSPFVWSG